MLNQPLFERVVAWIAARYGESHLHAARGAFERATGVIDETAGDYELRISHFLEQYVCDAAEGAIAAFSAETPSLDVDARRELAGWLRSHRSLFAFEHFDEEGGLVRDCIHGGAFRIWPTDHDSRLVPGDLFDCRLVPLGPLTCLSPGRVYHPRETHRALHALLAQVEIDALARTTLLDGLLLMRSRYLRFESVRPEHVYQARALAPVRFPLREP